MFPERLARLSFARSLTGDDALAWLQAHWQVLVLGAITLVAAALRLYQVTDNPRGFFADEAAVGVLADSVLHTGKDQFGEFLPLFFRNFGDYKLPFVVYADIPFVALLGRTELAVRSMVAILGSLTVITTYLMAKEMFRRELPAMLSAVFLAIMPWHIHYSRTGFGETVAFLLFLTLGLYLFLRAMREEGSILPAVLVFALSLYTYRAAWVVLPPLFLVMLVLYREELLRDRKVLLQSAGIFALFVLPIVRQVLSDSSDRSTDVWIFNVKSEKSTLELFVQFYKSYFTSDFLFSQGDNGPITRHFLPGQGMLYWFQLPLILMGLTAAIARPSRAHAVLIVLFLAFPLGGALSESSPHSLRALAGAVPFALLSALGVAFLVDTLSSLLRDRREQVTFAVLAVVSVFAVLALGGYLRHYYDDYPRLSAGFWGWQDGPQAIMQRFLREQDRYDQLVLSGDFNAPDVFIRFYAGQRCPKCIVGGNDTYQPGKRQLFAMRAEALKPAEYEYRMLDQLTYPDGRPSFYFLEIVRKR